MPRMGGPPVSDLVPSLSPSLQTTHSGDAALQALHTLHNQ